MTRFARRARVVCAGIALLVAAKLASAQPAKPVELPSNADIKAAVETLRDVFDKEYAAAEKDAKGKKALAVKLLGIAPQRKTPAMVYACYDEARLLSAQAGDLKVTLGAFDNLNRRFVIDPKHHRETLQLLSEADLKPADAMQLAKLARDTAAAFLDEEKYEQASDLAGIAVAAAKKAEDVDAANEARAFKTRVETLTAAIATIKTKPDDPDANAALGGYWAFDRGRWDTGVKFLARGSDKPLAEAATKDLAKPTTAKERTALADLLYKLAKDAPADRKAMLLERAWEWYSGAVVVANGDDDLKPSVRAREIETSFPELFNKVFAGHTEAAAAVAVTPDGKRLVSVGNDNIVRIWDAATGNLLSPLDGHTSWIGSVVITPDGSKAITAGGDNSIRIWDLKSDKEAGTLEGHSVAVRGLALTADSKFLVSGGSDKTCRMWDLSTRKEIKMYGERKESVESVAVTPDGRFVLAGNDAGTVTVYDARSGEIVSKFDKHAGSMVYSIAVTKDGKTAISGARDKEIRVWDIATGKQLRTLAGHTEQVYQVVLSPDERHVLSVSFDKTVRVWDFATGRELKRFEGHADCVQGACFSPNGRSAYSASWDKTLRRWRIPAAQEVTNNLDR